MTSVLVLAGAWILVGIPAIIAIVRERRTPDLHFARAMDALGHQPAPSAPRPRISVSKRRAQVTAATYVSAAAVLSIGFVLSSPLVLGGAVVLLNLGTFYRISVLRMRAVAAQRQAPRTPPAFVLPPAPPEPPMVAILGPVSTGPVLSSAPMDGADDERVVLIG